MTALDAASSTELSKPTGVTSNASTTASCPAIFIAAPASGQGKTTLSAGLARFHARAGRDVRVFKTGPDYLDPQVLAKASGHPVLQLDLWMAGAEYCQQMLFEAALVADLIIIEGAMGMLDGEPSSADLAARFGIPIVLVMDVKGMAQTAGAIVKGLAEFRDDYTIQGLIANACASERHRELIESTLPKDLPILASIQRDPNLALPERHLGLVQADELGDQLEQPFEAAADYFIDTPLAELPPAIIFEQPELNPLVFVANASADVDAGAENFQAETQPLAGINIGVARDPAFSFIYQVNLDLLELLGATLTFFSPLNDAKLPAVDGLWLPGGYPELHAKALSENHAMRNDIAQLAQQGKPILAECGGFLYCLNTLTDLDEQCFDMVGALDGEGAMRGKRGCQGMQTAPLPEGEVRGHAHHRSRATVNIDALSHGRRQRHPAPGEAIYRQGGITGSYLHLFFPSNPMAIARLFRPELMDQCQERVAE